MSSTSKWLTMTGALVCDNRSGGRRPEVLFDHRRRGPKLDAIAGEVAANFGAEAAAQRH